MDQQVQEISIKELILWTENPRDPIDINATDQQIVDKALDDRYSKWTLAKLAKEMGDYYDFSELPTVVYHGKKPVVYDGNRRMILGKIKHNLVSIGDREPINLPDFPSLIPCNVCVKKIALQNVLRKHGDSGSWQPLERDIFLHKFMGESKSPFLILEEDTKIISSNPHLNQRFVKEEIFKEEGLKSLGFSLKNGRLKSVHSDTEAYKILNDISKKIKDKQISTRNNRGRILQVLEPISQELIEQNKNNRQHLSRVNFGKPSEEKDQRHTKRTPKKETELFGGKLYLYIGDVSNLYRDIVDLYQFYLSNRDNLSHSFPSLIRMSLRLLCETAAKDSRKTMDKFLKEHFANAKKTLDQNIKTTLANQNVNDNSIVQLLHTGAHNYETSNNMEQTLAVSFIIGAILTITHGKKD
ncbi:MAG: hypothetical protein JNL65_08180 [Saprospiraceae bacterium]|nr:hypothetical protein [Saprospiraceae bacterium]